MKKIKFISLRVEHCFLIELLQLYPDLAVILVDEQVPLHEILLQRRKLHLGGFVDSANSLYVSVVVNYELP